MCEFACVCVCVCVRARVRVRVCVCVYEKSVRNRVNACESVSKYPVCMYLSEEKGSMCVRVCACVCMWVKVCKSVCEESMWKRVCVHSYVAHIKKQYACILFSHTFVCV